MENNFCKKCGKCCTNIAVDNKLKIMYRNGIEPISDSFKNMLEEVSSNENITYYRCKYLRNGLCLNSSKPEECNNYPQSPFAYIPNDCGYEGYVFLKQEKIKQSIRKKKEEILHYTALINSIANQKEKNSYKKIIQNLERTILQYKKYGSLDW